MPRLSSHIYLLVFSILLIGFYSCDSKINEKEAAVALSAANWNDTTTIGKVINDYYKDSVSKVGEIAMKIRDPFMTSRVPYQYLQLHKVLRPQFKKTSKTIGFMPVLMMGLADSAIVDFQITWQQPNLKDSVGAFVVTDKSVQRIGNQLRYEWVQEGEYWIRKNVEVPEEMKTNKQLKSLDLEEIKEMQEKNLLKKGK